MIKNRLIKHKNSFGYAIEGLVWAFSTQLNYQIHAFCSVLALVLGFFYNISSLENVIIVFLIAVGFAIETINTAIECLADAIDKNWREDIKIAKDVSAGAMLVFAIGAFVIACIIFLPKIVAYHNLFK